MIRDSVSSYTRYVSHKQTGQMKICKTLSKQYTVLQPTLQEIIQLHNNLAGIAGILRMESVYENDLTIQIVYPCLNVKDFSNIVQWVLQQAAS